MPEKKKKIIIGASIAGVVLLLVILIVVISNNKKAEGNVETLENADLSELINLENIESLAYETEETKEEISSQYITGREIYEVKANIQAGETEGKMIYVRGKYDKLNIYKTEYTLNKYGDKTQDIRKVMQDFEMTCEGYMEIIEQEYEETEHLYGESSMDFELPIEESIYIEGRLYSKTYKSEENEYDINFYKQDDKIICEFVKKL